MNEIKIIQSQLKAPKSQYNAFGKYKYRSCEDILEAVKPLLTSAKCYLTLSDEVVAIGSRIYVKATATLVNEAGERVESVGYAREEETKKGMDGSQITGASSSYARKYALNGLFCIDDTKDSDSTNTGNAAPVSAASFEELAKMADPIGAIARQAMSATTKQQLGEIYRNNRGVLDLNNAESVALKNLIIEKGKRL